MSTVQTSRLAEGDDHQQPVQIVPAARRPRRRNRVRLTVLCLVALLLMLPFLTLLLSGLTPAADIDHDSWLPSSLRWQNISDAVKIIPYGRYASDSVFLSTVLAGLTTMTSAVVGYGFARLTGPGKRFLFGVLIALMIVPQIVTLIPTYLLFTRFGLVGNYWPWVLWGLSGAPYAIFLYRQFFSGFPKELEEAARIDGAGHIRIFLSIFFPLSRPLIVTAFVLAFNATWGDYIAPNLFLNQDNTTLAAGISSGYVNDQGFQVNNLLAAGAFLYVIPVIVLFLFAQRSYVKGFVSSGIK
jgi:multiple sugar transport system permease protein